MTGFKNFLLRGSFIELAVAFILGAAFATVVAAFTAWITSLLPWADTTFNDDEPL
ncbi:MAG TPA: MscL family protein, partial [Nocardioidaceae bacterium]|nr:MscL family protein [Nocardioidaceae bacterium]